jgi:hypothetical protein
MKEMKKVKKFDCAEKRPFVQQFDEVCSPRNYAFSD